LLAEARKTDYTRDLPFILVASKEHREDLVRARAAGAKGCVTREEFTPDRMAAMIGSTPPAGRRQMTSSPVPGDPVRLLVVDDSPSIAAVIREMVEGTRGSGSSAGEYRQGSRGDDADASPGVI
jgi:CheY-like chemotaxis protein